MDVAKPTNDLDLNINLNQLLRQWVDFDKTRVNSSVKTTEFRDKPDISLIDWSIWVWAAETAWNSA